jgi:predicted aminopeptidase
MFNNYIYRIILFLLCFISVVLGYWFITFALVICGCIIYRNYYEIAFFGLMYDSLFGLGINYTGSLIAFISFILVFYGKRIFIGYVNN